MAAAVDISMIGDKEVIRSFNKLLDERSQKRIVRLAQRKSLRRYVSKFVQAVSGHPVGVRTGTLVTAVAQMKPKAARGRRNSIQTVIDLPTRETLGIDAKSKGYYPAVLEYGSPKLGIPPKGWIRGTVNRFQDEEVRMMGTDIGKAIERQFKRGK